MAKRPTKTVGTNVRVGIKSESVAGAMTPAAGPFNVTVRAAPNMSGWLKVTSQKSGYFIFVPLPIRLIHQIPDDKGGGCIVRGANGDESTTKESVTEILEALNGYPVGGAASTWASESWALAK